MSKTGNEVLAANEETDTNPNIDKSFGDNFVDKNLNDKSLSLKKDSNNIDNNSRTFEPLEDSRQYIG